MEENASGTRVCIIFVGEILIVKNDRPAEMQVFF
jgi:hypothetical protein